MTRLRTARLAGLLIAVLAALAIVGAPRAAFAQERRIETAARDALKKARADYQAKDLKAAVVRLKKALKACGTIRCTPATRGQLFMDLGAVQLRKGDKSAASQAFVEAIRSDGKLSPGAPYDGPEMRAEWNATRDEVTAASEAEPAGDFDSHAAVEQVEGTPLPIYVEASGSAHVESAVVKYRGTGETEWKKLALARKGRGWGALVPCGDVRRGVLRYYVQGFDGSGSPVALSGDPKRPFTVPIRHSIASPAPALPGDPPPVQCTKTGQCPPELPRCNEVSTADHETPPQCDEDSQCASGVCEDGRCVTSRGGDASRGFARWWVGVSASADLVSLPGADDVCLLSSQAVPANDAGYYCTHPNGVDYPSRKIADQNQSLAPGQAGHVDGGPSFAAVRVMVSVDYALNASMLIGARVGYVAHGYPGAAAKADGRFATPIHAEVRGTYVLGQEPLAHAGFAPFVFVGGGAAEFAAEKDVMVRQSNPPQVVAGQLPKNAWLVNGPLFLAAGGGARYAFSQRIAFSAGLKLSAVFGGGFIPVLSPELALQYGF